RHLTAGTCRRSGPLRGRGRRRERPGFADCEGRAVAASARPCKRLCTVAEIGCRAGTRSCMTLEDLRRDIDRVDEVLVRLLNERARCVCEVGRLKKEQ